MSGFDEAFLKEVRERNDIVSVVGDYVALRKAGTSYKGLCPFHAEKSPSFHVHADRQFFYCFGCQTGGDVISFVREINGYSFTEAVRHLADRASLPVPDLRSFERDPSRRSGQASKAARDNFYEVNRLAQKFFTECVDTVEGSACRDYLRGRAIERETALRFGLGFAPDRWDGLVSALARDGVDLRVAESLGLVVKKTSGSGYYDRFRNRLMFPIRSVAGEVLGFSGRTLGQDPETAKYVNSPDSPVYQKGDTVFGLFEARQAMRKANRALIVEGNVDLVSLSQAGLTEVIAPLGTALTASQCRLLKRFVPQVVALYDGDGAGREAAKKAAALSLAEGLALQVASLPDKEDPDSFVRKHGRAELDALLSKARPAWEFLAAQAIAETRALESVQGARLAVEKLAPILHELPSPEERTLFERQLAETLRMDDKLVADIARSAQRRAPVREGEALVARPVEAPIPLSDLKLLEMLVLVPGARALYAGRDIESLVSDSRTRDVAERLVDVEGGVSEALEVIPPGTARDQLMRRLSEAPQMADGLGAFEKLVMVLRRESVERKLESIRRDERQAWLSRDEEMALSLSLQKMKLERQRDDLLKAIRD